MGARQVSAAGRPLPARPATAVPWRTDRIGCGFSHCQLRLQHGRVSASAADRRFFERVLVRKEVARDAAEGAGRVAAAAEGEERLLIGDARLLERLARLRAADSLAACRSSSQHSIEHRRVDAAGVASSTVKVARASCCAMISGWVS